MRRRAAGTAVAVFVATALAGVAAGEDDLDVVRRAVADDHGPASPAPEAVPAPTKGKAPQWLKVRVVDKSSRKARVAVNLPLGLVRALGSDLPVDWHCRSPRAKTGSESCSIRIGDVLRTLESGQGIVEIDDPEATVRVWVE